MDSFGIGLRIRKKTNVITGEERYNYTLKKDIAHRMVGASRYTGVPRLRQTSQDFEDKCRADITNVSASQFIGMRPSYRALIDALDSLGSVDLSKICP